MCMCVCVTCAHIPLPRTHTHALPNLTMYFHSQQYKCNDSIKLILVFFGGYSFSAFYHCNGFRLIFRGTVNVAKRNDWENGWAQKTGSEREKEREGEMNGIAQTARVQISKPIEGLDCRFCRTHRITCLDSIFHNFCCFLFAIPAGTNKKKKEPETVHYITTFFSLLL